MTRKLVQQVPFEKIKTAVMAEFATAQTFATPNKDLFYLKHNGKIILPGKVPPGKTVRAAWENVYVYLYNTNKIGSINEEDQVVSEILNEE